MNKSLLFFTSEFPYGLGETFIENEIDYLSREFKKVYIFPEVINKQKRTIPANCQVVGGLFSDKGYNRNSILKKYPIQVMQLFLSEFWHHGKLIDSKNELFSQCLRMVYKASILENWLDKNNIRVALFYTFWMDDWTTILSILKTRNRIKQLISRANGFDIFEERRENNFIPYRHFQLKMVDKIYCASKASMTYLKNRYPKYAMKIDYAHLGVTDHGLNPWSKSDHFTIVSCSNIIALKRVSLIPGILAKLELNICWMHFGDGIGKEELREQIQLLPENIAAELRGRVSNQELLEFYKTNSIDLFIHFSESEGGVPVSIQEAVSFGIPVLATDVGGINEIVNNTTGILIEKEFDPIVIARTLDDFLLNKAINQKYRIKVREFWKKNFNAKNIYPKFIGEFKKI